MSTVRRSDLQNLQNLLDLLDLLDAVNRLLATYRVENGALCSLQFETFCIYTEELQSMIRRLK